MMRLEGPGSPMPPNKSSRTFEDLPIAKGMDEDALDKRLRIVSTGVAKKERGKCLG